MPLSNIEIWAEMGAGRLRITPPPDPDRVVGSSIDLLLHEELIVLPGRVEGLSINPSEIDVMDMLGKFGERITLSDSDSQIFKLEPHRLVIGKTFEEIELPLHLAARIEGKSSLARLGLSIHITAPTVQTGFKGRLVLEMYNVGPFDLQLKPRMKIAQLIIEKLGLPATEGYTGTFQSQV